jgi:hypothetical protein
MSIGFILGQGAAFHIKLSAKRLGSAFLILDGLGLHAGWGKREIAWTRTCGWVVD